jgi:lipopolysaccharide/colanic/teichoic acid biosynthesis glycosyltransferase
VGEVIFSTDGIQYKDILSVIARSSNRSVNFRLVPSSLDAIIGKTRIDDLDTMPLVEIEYNIHKAANRAVKRAFDLVLAAFLLLVLYLPVRFILLFMGRRRYGTLVDKILLLPGVFAGRVSFVGLPLDEAGVPALSSGRHLPGVAAAFLGPGGLTGLVQINEREDLQDDERERYTMYYAKNQSLVLDLEIMSKSLLNYIRKERRPFDGKSGTGI